MSGITCCTKESCRSHKRSIWANFVIYINTHRKFSTPCNVLCQYHTSHNFLLAKVSSICDICEVAILPKMIMVEGNTQSPIYPNNQPFIPWGIFSFLSRSSKSIILVRPQLNGLNLDHAKRYSVWNKITACDTNQLTGYLK